ncbi:insulin-like growth factor-binding protein 5 isoform X2 [Passer domesticus]|uniref:insulin-like growth factor-binding protein 5 isoform X2 n=1 Tax=Passer domesticus TaxID=48849 RepID=UPI0030FE5EDE
MISLSHESCVNLGAAQAPDIHALQVSQWNKGVRSHQLPPCCHRGIRYWNTLEPLFQKLVWLLSHGLIGFSSSVFERESREHEEPTTSEMTEETYPPKAYRPKHGRLSELKAEALKKDRRKKLTLAKFVGMAENTAHPRVVIPELRQEFELGPCRRHMEASLQELKSSQRMVPRAVHLPNCDRKGFYKRKQCKPSRGRKRGLCWCVDKYGMKLPGTDFLSGDLQCHAFDSSNVE